jgi:prefoldin subunit 5
MDIKDLKAQAYDLLAQIEYLQAQLREVGGKIANYEEPADKKVEKPKKD